MDRRISSRLEDFQQIGEFLKDRRTSSRLEDIRQIGGAFPADLRISGGFEDFWQIAGLPADWMIPGRLRISGRCGLEDFPQIAGFGAYSIMSVSLKDLRHIFGFLID